MRENICFFDPWKCCRAEGATVAVAPSARSTTPPTIVVEPRDLCLFRKKNEVLQDEQKL